MKRIFQKIALLSAILGGLSGLTGYFYFSKTAWVTVKIKSNVNTNFKIYWANEGQNYDESHMGVIRINPVQTKYHLSIGDLKNIRRLRIDPSDNESRRAKILIHSITIHQLGYKTIQFSSRKALKKIRPIRGFLTYRLNPDGLIVTTEDLDPQLEAHLRPIKKDILFGDSVKIGLVTFLIVLFFVWIWKDGDSFRHIPMWLAFAAALIMCMAVFSKRNVHPDEYVHIAAGTYYENHWLPPKICASGTEYTYSVYGVSRLNSREIVYFLAGKLSKLLSFLPIATYLRLRLFNCILFLFICTICLRYADSRIFGFVFLLSPQIWYIFSYFNSDAFALLIAFIIGYQVSGKDTIFHRYLLSPWKIKTAFWGIGFGLLFATTVFIKKNYYVFILFLILVAIWRLYFEKNELGSYRRLFEKLAVLILSVLFCFAAWWVMDYTINGPKRYDNLLECREKLAHSIYKPSTPLEKKHPLMMLREKGVSIKKVFYQFHWGKIIFNSAFGEYGYMTISGSRSYYTAVKYLFIGFVLFMVFTLFFSSQMEKITLFFIVLFCSVLLIGAALHSSWTTMLQPQGRYLLPIAVMIGFFLNRLENHWLKIGLNIFINAFFILSLYSFMFVGLANIPKQWI